MSFPANLRGWGPGWPVDRSDDMAWVRAARSGARVQVHKGIAPIVQFLMDETEARGFLLDLGPTDTDDEWGYSNRPIRGKRVPSNHSWGLAVDLNAQDWPMGQKRNVPPGWLVALWESYGMEWGGRWSRPDPMHFEWQGSTTEARHMVAMLAASHLAGKPAPMPPVQMPDRTPDPLEVAEMFLVVEGLGIYACAPGIRPIFISPESLKLAQERSKGVPTLTLDKSCVTSARQSGL